MEKLKCPICGGEVEFYRMKALENVYIVEVK